ncbi:MazG-like family protein [Sphaerisporangium rhizosphaerae]|uniref:MazG-like family protein n=1 Tax=Sphaerisporangium rhizosphaerae TaxID=2269375 RepID=A0ABW2PB56_9ACTN
MDADAWEKVDQLVTWLDRASDLAPETELLLRLMKVSEETGEVAAAVIGALGQNPRKGVTHTWEQVDGELCDVILTAMVALKSRNTDAPNVFRKHVTDVVTRALGPPA